MNRSLSILLFLAGPTLLLAQSGSPGGRSSQPYQPAVPAPSTVNYSGGGWGGAPTANTAAGAAMSGMSQVISAAGDYNLSTSAAAVNMTEAQRNEIQNRQAATNAYFDMRATNRAAREAEAGPRPTMEQIVKIAQDGTPRAPNPSFLDPVSGRLTWPSALQLDQFGAQRQELEPLVQKRAVDGSLNYNDQTRCRQVIDSMYAGLKAQIRQIPPQDYVMCRDFLRSLMYWTTRNDLG